MPNIIYIPDSTWTDLERAMFADLLTRFATAITSRMVRTLRPDRTCRAMCQLGLIHALRLEVVGDPAVLEDQDPAAVRGGGGLVGHHEHEDLARRAELVQPMSRSKGVRFLAWVTVV